MSLNPPKAPRRLKTKPAAAKAIITMPKPKPSPKLNIAQKQAHAEAVFARLQQQNPEPKGELNYNNPYTLLVAVTLSAQATDVGVNKATHLLFQSVRNPKAMLELGLDGLISHIKTIGLYRAKAKHIIAMAQILVDEFGGEVPKRREDLERLPGVGRKTANVVLNIAFGEPTIAVDTHLFRLSHRLNLSDGKTPIKVEMDLLKIIPVPYLQHAHHWLILHGRYVCKARKPECAVCVLKDICPSFKIFNPQPAIGHNLQSD